MHVFFLSFFFLFKVTKKDHQTGRLHRHEHQREMWTDRTAQSSTSESLFNSKKGYLCRSVPGKAAQGILDPSRRLFARAGAGAGARAEGGNGWKPAIIRMDGI